jgi:ABC-type uncharacterized transport system permease subunit
MSFFVEDLWPFLVSIVRVSTPLAFAALGGFLSERAGVVNISLEGKMLLGAFSGAVTAHFLGNAWAGAAGAAAAGALVSLAYAFFAVTLRSNQIIVGTAVNLLALGLTPFLANVFFGSNSSTPSLPVEARFAFEPMPLAAVALVAVALASRSTLGGLWHRFAGENPEALAAAGVAPTRVRYVSLVLCGALVGLGGATLSLFLSSGFQRGMTGGRGFMALAALILGKWRPVPAVLACLLFGFFDAAQIRLQGVPVWGGYTVPVQFIQILPYLLTLLLLAGFIGRARAPKALGRPFP